MSILRGILGGRTELEERPTDAADADADEEERLHERELMLLENERLDDLRRRQLKYADRAWTPPAQGGDLRADDGAEGL